MIATGDDNELDDPRFMKGLDDTRDERTAIRTLQKGFGRAHAFRITGSENDSRKHASV